MNDIELTHLEGLLNEMTLAAEEGNIGMASHYRQEIIEFVESLAILRKKDVTRIF